MSSETKEKKGLFHLGRRNKKDGKDDNVMPVPPSTTSDSGISGRNTNQPAPSSTGDSGYNSRNSNQPSDGTPSFNSDTPSNSMKNTNNTNNTNNAGQEPKEIKIDAGGNVVTTTTTTTTTTTSTTGGRNNDQKSEPNSNKTSHLEPGPPQRARSRNADSVPQDISSSDVNSPTQDSPPIPTRSTRRQSPQPSSREPMTPLPQYGTNFSRPNARSPNPTMAATHNEAQRVGTVEGLKQAAAEIHGAGEILRSTVNSAADRYVPLNRENEGAERLAQHGQVANTGREEIENRRLKYGKKSEYVTLNPPPPPSGATQPVNQIPTSANTSGKLSGILRKPLGNVGSIREQQQLQQQRPTGPGPTYTTPVGAGGDEQAYESGYKHGRPLQVVNE